MFRFMVLVRVSVTVYNALYILLVFIGYMSVLNTLVSGVSSVHTIND